MEDHGAGVRAKNANNDDKVTTNNKTKKNNSKTPARKNRKNESSSEEEANDDEGEKFHKNFLLISFHYHKNSVKLQRRRKRDLPERVAE